jgi:sterol desaturase/sphingolipid hydroxylase (fatty acid hydroxylase superfamily)
VIAPLVTFWVLVAAAATRAERRAAWANKPRRDWLLDGVGLLVQGALVPLAELTLIVCGLTLLAPGLRGRLHLPGNELVFGFILNFLIIDYFYYWNHRLLHTRRLWPLHRVHHSVGEMDVLATSRNTAWSSLLILYVWVNGIALFLLAHPAGYAAGAALTASLDLWRHSELSPRPGGGVARVLGWALVLPRDHAWHHASDNVDANFGANLCWWDRLHGTWLAEVKPPAQLGVPVALPLWRQLWWPFS